MCRGGLIFYSSLVDRAQSVSVNAVMSRYHATDQLASSQLGSYSGPGGWLQLSLKERSDKECPFPKKVNGS